MEVIPYVQWHLKGVVGAGNAGSLASAEACVPGENSQGIGGTGGDDDGEVLPVVNIYDGGGPEERGAGRWR